MSAPRRAWTRMLLAIAIVVLGLLEGQSLLQTLQAQARLRERVVGLVEGFVHKARPRLQGVAHVGAGASQRLAREAVAWGLGREVEVFLPSGEPLAAAPQPAPVEHWPEDPLVPGSELVTFGPVAGRPPRLLTYAVFSTREDVLVVRFANEAADLVADLEGRGALLAGHGLVLVALLLAGVLILYPTPSVGPVSTPQALSAYEEAMQRLRTRGLEQTRLHAAERRHLEDEIEDKEAMARAGELTSAVIHEVRNGLGTILANARLIERGAGEGDEAGVLAAAVREECETLEGIIRRFMDFVRREELACSSFEIGRLLSRVVARETGGRAGADVVLPRGDGGVLVGDEDLLERVFENLVRNAREAAGAGGHVWVELTRSGQDVEISVVDDGPGLPAQVRERLRPFVTTKPGGLGLGLPIALKLVRLHGGELSLGDRKPHGLVVTVRLPASGPPADGAATAA